METLIEKLYNNNVIFSYYGFIDSSVLKQVLEITRSKLQNNSEPEVLVNRVHNALNDCVENIIQHNFYPDDTRVHYKSLLVVSKHDNDYHIDTLNVVNSIQKKSIDTQLKYLDSKSKTELEELKTEVTAHKDTMPVNTHIIDLMLKADDYGCTFKDLNPNYLFNINFKISTVTEASLN
jgi:hypothetical protein